MFLKRYQNDWQVLKNVYEMFAYKACPKYFAD